MVRYHGEDTIDLIQTHLFGYDELLLVSVTAVRYRTFLEGQIPGESLGIELDH